MSTIHLTPLTTPDRYRRTRLHRANNTAAKMFLQKVAVPLLGPPVTLEALRRQAQAVCWQPLEGIVGECMARKYHQQSDLVCLMAERLTARIEQALS